MIRIITVNQTCILVPAYIFTLKIKGNNSVCKFPDVLFLTASSLVGASHSNSV